MNSETDFGRYGFEEVPIDEDWSSDTVHEKKQYQRIVLQ